MNYTYYRRYQAPRRKNSSFRSFFWFVVVLFTVLLLLRACVHVLSSLSESKKDEATLTLYKGSAEVLEWGQSEPENASDAQLVLEGDQVQTHENTWATLSFYNGTRVHLDQNTRLILESVVTDAGSEQANLQLLEGRLWVDHFLEDGELDIHVNTDLMTIQSLQGQYLLSHTEAGEALFVQEGPVTAQYVDRNKENSIIETVVLRGGEMSLLDPEKQAALLARQNITLVEPAADGLFVDAFIQWCTGIQEELPEEEAPVEDSEEPVSEDVVPEEVPEEELPIEESQGASLQISLDSPSSGATIQKDAIALEGHISSGRASTVTVTWSGNGQAYTLSGFNPGDSSFRYVADVDYGNYALGDNTYTVVAYDENGQASNVLTIVLHAEF